MLDYWRLTEMPTLKNYHILISHSWDYNDQYETVKKENYDNYKLMYLSTIK